MHPIDTDPNLATARANRVPPLRPHVPCAWCKDIPARRQHCDHCNPPDDWGKREDLKNRHDHYRS